MGGKFCPGDYRAIISIETAKKNITDSFPNFKINSIEYLGEGINNTTFIANNEYVFRFVKHEEADEFIENEIAILPLITEKVELKIPEFQYKGTQKENNYKIVAYKMIKGVSLDEEIISNNIETKKQAIIQIGFFLQQLHSIDPNEAEKAGLKHRNVYQYYLSQREDAREHLYPVIENIYPQNAVKEVSLASFF